MKKNKYKITAALFFGALCIITSCKKNDNCNFETTCQETAPSGYMVGTMASTPTSNWVGTVFNTQNNSNAPIGNDWNDPALGANKVTSIHPAMWTPANIGQVFGIALDHSGGIYLSATDIYKHDSAYAASTAGFVITAVPSGYGAAGASGIYFTNYSNLSITTPLVTTQTFPYVNTVGTAKIPNSGIGVGNSIGNMAYDYANNQLFATNLEDGRIYRINATTGIVKSIFDPFNPDGETTTPGMAVLNEQLWGIGVLTQAGITSVYFARTTTTGKEIWSIALDGAGEFIATAAGGGLFKDVAMTAAKKQIANVPGTQNKITDIAFSSTGKMLLAERGHPHAAGILEYIFSGTTWGAGNNFYLGADLSTSGPYLFGKNSAGGVDYSNREVKNAIPNFICNDIVWASSNACATKLLPYFVGAYPNLVYGVQGMPSGGNNGTTLSINAANDLYIDYNVTGWPHLTTVKGKIGDVEFFDPVCPCK